MDWKRANQPLLQTKKRLVAKVDRWWGFFSVFLYQIDAQIFPKWQNPHTHTHKIPIYTFKTIHIFIINQIRSLQLGQKMFFSHSCVSSRKCLSFQFCFWIILSTVTLHLSITCIPLKSNPLSLSNVWDAVQEC